MRSLPSSHYLGGMFGRKTRQALDGLTIQVQTLIQETRMATVQLQKIIDAVAAEKTVVDGAVKLLNSIPDLIKAAVPGADPATQAALDDLAAQVGASNAELQAAVVANTPAAPTATDPGAPATPPATTDPATTPAT